MKKLTAGFLLLLAPCAFAGFGDNTGPWSTTSLVSSSVAVNSVGIVQINASGTPGSTTFLRGDGSWQVPGGSGDVLKASTQTFTGGNTFSSYSVFSGSITATNSSNALAGASLTITGPITAATTTVTPQANTQVNASNFYAQYNGDGVTTGVLATTVYTKMIVNDNQNVTSDHYGGSFSEVVVASTGSQAFSFGGERHAVGVSTVSSFGTTIGALIAGIDHVDWNGPSTSSPTADVTGYDNRAEITLPDRTTERTDPIEANVVNVRLENYGPLARRRYHMKNDLDVGKILNEGPIISFSSYTQTMNGSDSIHGDGGGGLKEITAASNVTTDGTNPFDAPNISTTGTSTKGVVQSVVNNGTGGSGAITIKNATNFLTFGGLDQTLAVGDAMLVGSNGSSWVQLAPAQKQNGQIIGKSLIVNAGTSTGTYNASGILDELIISSGMSSGSASETTLYGYSVPSGMFVSTASTSVPFPTRQAISIDAAGTTVNATLEEVKVYFGSTVILDSGAGNFSASSWTVHCDVTQIGTGTSQIAACHFFDGTTIVVNSNTAPAEASTPFIKITGTASVATLNAVKVNQVILKKE